VSASARIVTSMRMVTQYSGRPHQVGGSGLANRLTSCASLLCLMSYVGVLVPQWQFRRPVIVSNDYSRFKFP
jgi:hypothetical protein